MSNPDPDEMKRIVERSMKANEGLIPKTYEELTKMANNPLSVESANLKATPIPDTERPTAPTITLGEYVLVLIERGKEEKSAGGIIMATTDKSDLARGKVLSVGAHAEEKRYLAGDGRPVRIGDTVLFSAKAGVKLDGQRHIVDIDSVFGVERAT